ncbi:hypothetical protein CTI12_AA391250 [Artemisia annua]|uniref:Helitron helicase-like domain-containing protein n=1 Tax=Artemisia annua TaxID=35608 RepID=A0A2U1MDZ5_ARTAN|nr:hypothetical protein CTI12_AA391250 [Artemisia annua]
MRTKGKAKIRTTNFQNICLNNVRDVSELVAPPSLETDMPGARVLVAVDHHQRSPVGSCLKRKSPDTPVERDTTFGKRLAYETSEGGVTHGASVELPISCFGQLNRVDGPFVVNNLASNDQPSSAAFHGPVVLDFAAGTVVREMSNTLVELHDVGNNNGKRPFSAFASDMPEPCSSSKRTCHEIVSCKCLRLVFAFALFVRLFHRPSNFSVLFLSAAFHGPVVLDFAAGTVVREISNTLVELHDVANNNGKRPFSAFASHMPEPCSSSKRTCHEIVSCVPTCHVSANIASLNREITHDVTLAVPVSNMNGKRQLDSISENVRSETDQRKRQCRDLPASFSQGDVLPGVQLRDRAPNTTACTLLPVSQAATPDVMLPGLPSVGATSNANVDIPRPTSPTPLTDNIQTSAPSNSHPLPCSTFEQTGVSHASPSHRGRRRRFPRNSSQRSANHSAHTVRSGAPVEYRSFGPCNCVCSHCHAKFWYEERLAASTRRSGPLYHHCCRGGKVQLFAPFDYPEYIQQLFLDEHFLRHIRAYNQMFGMTSLGATVDDTVNNGRGPYVFKVSGQIYHSIGRFCPDEGVMPRFLQLYINDTNNEVRNRLENFTTNGQTPLRQDIVEGLIELLDQHNALVQLFRTARDKLQDTEVPEFKVMLFNVVGSAQHELPTADEVGAIVFDSGPENEPDFDIIIEAHSGEPQRINGTQLDDPTFSVMVIPNTISVSYPHSDHHIPEVINRHQGLAF